MKAGSYRYNWNGDNIRVVIAGDVVALPNEGWACGGFGNYISEEWLLTQPKPRIPGRKEYRKVLAQCIVEALDEHHTSGELCGECEGTGESYPVAAALRDGFPPTDCGACNGTGRAG